MEKAYSLTPKISNEIFVRKTLRQNLVNSRRKFIFALLEQYGDPTLGLQGYTPDVSLFRTFMLNTGLYQEHEQGHYAGGAPDRLARQHQSRPRGQRPALAGPAWLKF